MENKEMSSAFNLHSLLRPIGKSLAYIKFTFPNLHKLTVYQKLNHDWMGFLDVTMYQLVVDEVRSVHVPKLAFLLLNLFSCAQHQKVSLDRVSV